MAIATATVDITVTMAIVVTTARTTVAATAPIRMCTARVTIRRPTTAPRIMAATAATAVATTAAEFRSRLASEQALSVVVPFDAALRSPRNAAVVSSQFILFEPAIANLIAAFAADGDNAAI